ncbi:glycosyl transferase [Lactococcus hodotermopsidis]|uniref:Glycosyl transferase n=1 Tax=Pseudolactococcus hodotermopsidis TaxID=2709157 RepID=A0A6A0BDJ7_9LACT|nr:glycosyltransferase family 4 protein [Lactococcus hodotermopsidis]GFH42418.1 glycosyl transferase [Lactococcus hodotermopsidis]
MKKILFLSPLGGSENGADIAMNHQMTYLSRLGYDIHLITAVVNTVEFDVFLRQNDIKHHLLDYTWWYDSNLKNDGDAVRNTKAITSIVSILTKEKIDTAITNTANIPQLAIAAALCNVPHLWLVHEFPEGEFAYTQEKYDFIGSFSNEILAASDVLAENITKLSSKTPISYFNPFTDVSTVTIGENNSPTRLVSVNTVNGERKNTQELIEIYGRLQKQFPKLELVVTGAIVNEEYYEKLKEYISNHHIQNVTFLNDYESNWRNVNTMDIFVNTSAMETFGLTMIECLKLGIVTVVANNYATESMEKLGYLSDDDIYELGNIEEAVAKISAKLNDFAKAKQWALTLQKKVLSEQSIEKITKNLLSAIEKYDSNPRRELRYFRQQAIATSNELDVRMQLIESNRFTLEERLAIINEQSGVLEERLALIEGKDKLLEERLTLIVEKDNLLTERLAMIEAQQEKLTKIERNKWYKIGRKLGIL